MNKKRTGILIVVSGFSGSGKGAIMNRLISDYGDRYALSISATTRSPRPGEAHGREYFFVTTEEFEHMIRQEELIEFARYVNNYYGTPKQYVSKQLAEGKDVILEIEIQGALKIRETFPDALLLFVMPPSACELKKRLQNRGTEDAETIASRLARAVEETQGIERYDYFVINDVLEEAVYEVHSIIQMEHNRISRNQEMIAEIKQDLRGFVKGE